MIRGFKYAIMRDIGGHQYLFPYSHDKQMYTSGLTNLEHDDKSFISRYKNGKRDAVMNSENNLQ
jgi:hypothetical protein